MGTLDDYFASGVPSQHSLCKAPEIRLRIDPSVEVFTLRARDDGTVPDLKDLEHVEADVEDHEDGTWALLRIDARDMRYEAYSVAVSIAESMRAGASFARAANEAVSNLKALISARTRLSESQQHGLLAELLLLRTLVDEFGTASLEWWLGPAAEQHDFACPSYDLEVKCTTAERRLHVVSAADQLKPNPARPLWVLSVQITRGGGADGIRLADLVSQMQTTFSGDSRFRSALQDLGWRDEDADLYTRSFLLRTAPAAFLVDGDFPAVTTDRLRSAVPNADLISDLTYRIDLTDRTPGVPGAELTTFLHAKDMTA